MTYCVAMQLNRGLVFLSDSRTNAGVDQISTFRKMTVFERPGERLLVMMSAGNLAITQAVRQIVCENPEAAEATVWSARGLFDAVRVVGDAVRAVQRRDGAALHEAGIEFNCSFVVGGQIRGEASRLFHVYAAGNFIEATPENPYFQIGESKYGKPIVDRIVTPETALGEAAKCALISMDSTLRSNISVGLPLDLLVYEADSLRVTRFVRIDEANAYMKMIRSTWGARLRQVFAEIPDPVWRGGAAGADGLPLENQESAPVRAPLPAAAEGAAAGPGAGTPPPAPLAVQQPTGKERQWPSTSRCTIARLPLRPRRSPCRRTSYACVRRRTAARRSLSYSLTVEPADALRQLAAGSVRQLPGAAGLPGAHAPSCASTSTWSPRWRSSTRSTSSSSRAPSTSRSPTRPSCAATSRRTSRPSRPRRCCEPSSASVDRRAPAHASTSWSTSTSALQHDIGYLIRMEPGVQTPEETLRRRAGSCRDTGWLLVQMPAPARARGALRLRLPDPAHARRRRRSTARRAPSGDFTDLHAWCEVYLPGRRLDRPRSDLGPARRRRPHSARVHAGAGQRGAGHAARSKTCEVEFEHAMTVHAHPRSAARHQAVHARRSGRPIDALGRAVDADLRAQDVRLTHGRRADLRRRSTTATAPSGTPTRSGPTKRGYADRPGARACARASAPGGFLHFGQGKWYPGEPLPRWALSCLLARGRRAALARSARCSPTNARRAATASTTRARFMRALAQRLGLAPALRPSPAYEDAWYYLWRERRLPVNVDPVRQPARRRTGARRACAASSTAALRAVVGYALPLRRASAIRPWPEPAGKRALVPARRAHVPGAGRFADGLSPAARLAALGHGGGPAGGRAARSVRAPARPARGRATARTGPVAAAAATPRPPTGGAGEVAGAGGGARRRGAGALRARPRTSRAPRCASSRARASSTSSCRRWRGSRTTSSCSPRSRRRPRELRHAGDRSKAIRRRAIRACKRCQVTPDPGVIEVNVHPARAGPSWSTAPSICTRRRASRACRPRSSCSTAATPAPAAATTSCSAARRRPTARSCAGPTCCASLVAYWHNHPSLSYLFSGLFIGPTSQAPRVDEARNDQLYELEIAFGRAAPPGASGRRGARRGWSIGCCAIC